MLPFLCLLVLCGFLTQNVQGNGHPLAIANFSPELLHQLISQRMNTQDWKDHIQKLPLEEVVKDGMKQGGGGLLGGLPLLGGLVNNIVGGILGVKIRNIELLKLKIKFDENVKEIMVIVPADIELEVNCPLNLMHRIVHLKLYLDVQVGVKMVTDPYTGHIKLIIGNCHNNPGHLRITLLDNISPLFQLLNKIVRLVTDILEKTVPHLLQKELCPLANGLVQSVLDLLQGSISSQVRGEKFQLSPESFRLHDDSFQAIYTGQVQRPGGQSLMIPPGSAPLPSIPRDGSPLNMVVSSHYLAAAVRALLPAQVFNIGSQSEGAVFTQQIAAVLPEASNIRALQVATGVPSLSLTVGKIQLWQPIEIRFYTEHPGGAYGPLLTIRVNVVYVAHPSIEAGKLILTLHSTRIENLNLLSSSIGNFDVQRLVGVVTRVVSTLLLRPQNEMLKEGIPMPLVNSLGLKQVNVAVGKDALLLVVPHNVASASA